ncbi:MBL fold metallo-hydrolase [uncultured Salinisphaera sp.]|uniref:MBL fold metallo-hydrolase n=1 Tax=uncultured Salinisphaera sp. TaxID=359372 RepID=UPI0032B1CA17
MKLKQIRNATLRIDIGGVKFLLDPYLGDTEVYSGFEGTLNDHLRNPRIPLQTSMEEILDVDAVIVTHTHDDHWDEAAIANVPKDLPVFAQHAADAELLASQGFEDVRVLTENSEFNGVSLIRTPGQHGSDEALAAIPEILGEVCGVVFKHPDEARTLYVAGDTVWNRHVEDNLARHTPDVIVLNAGDAQVPGLGSIIMGTTDVTKVYETMPEATLVASHLDAVNHCALSRNALREYVQAHDMTDRVLVPADDEAYSF